MYAERNQDRQAYQMDIRFQSDQDPDWSQTVHLNNDNWFIPQKIHVCMFCMSLTEQNVSFGNINLQFFNRFKNSYSLLRICRNLDAFVL